MRPRELAKELAKVESTNFLAHTIRNIEDIIFQMAREDGTGFNYHMSVRINEEVAKSKCYFAHRGCTIFLPKQLNDPPTVEDIKILRISMAHELGHIALHLEHILAPDKMNKMYKERDIQEEASAWEFAHELIKEKSEFHKSNSYTDYTYKNTNEIYASIVGMLKRNPTTRNQEVLAELKKRNFPYT